MIYDIAIIAAGLMGLSTAYWLNKIGTYKIAMIDRIGYIGGHSTTRCSGGIRYQYSNYSSIMMSKLNKALIDSISVNESVDFGFLKCGYAFAVTNFEKEKEYLSAVKLQQNCGINTKVFYKDEFKKIFPQLDYSGVSFVTYCESEGRLNVNALLSYLKNKTQDNLNLYLSNEVKNIEKKNDSFIISVSDKDIKCKKLVNAAGPWASDIAHMLGHDLHLTKTEQIVIVSDAFEKIPKNFPMIIYPDIGIGFHEESGGILFQYYRPYIVSSVDNLEGDYSWIIKSISNAICRYPNMKKAHLVSKWVGYYDETADGLPILGESNAIKGLFNICGFNGHGFMHGLIAGKMLAEVIMEKYNYDIDLSLFSDKRNALIKKNELYKV